MKTDDKHKASSRNRRDQAPARKRSTAWPVLLIVGCVALAGIGYTLIKDGKMQTLVDRVSGTFGSTVTGGSSGKDGSAKKSGSQAVAKKIEEPVPKALVLSAETRGMLSQMTSNVDYIDLGDTIFTVEPAVIVSEDDGVQLTGDRNVRANLDLGSWNISDALEAVGHSERIDEFSEIAELSALDQLDIVLTATEKDGIAFDYDVDTDALLAVKQSLVEDRTHLFQWELNDAKVMQIGRPGGQEPMLLHVTFLSGETRGFTVEDRAQHTVHWFVSRLKEPDQESANAVRASLESGNDGLAVDAPAEE